jgi:hypothetical protein
MVTQFAKREVALEGIGPNLNFFKFGTTGPGIPRIEHFDMRVFHTEQQPFTLQRPLE